MASLNALGAGIGETNMKTKTVRTGKRKAGCVEIALLFACTLLYVVTGTVAGMIEMNDGINDGTFDYPQSAY